MTYEGESTNSKYSLTSTYSQFENETSNKKYKFWNVEARDSIQTATNNKVTFGTEFRVTEGSAYVASGSDRAEQYALYVQVNIVPAVNCCLSLQYVTITTTASAAILHQILALPTLLTITPVSKPITAVPTVLPL